MEAARGRSDPGADSVVHFLPRLRDDLNAANGGFDILP